MVASASACSQSGTPIRMLRARSTRGAVIGRSSGDLRTGRAYRLRVRRSRGSRRRAVCRIRCSPTESESEAAFAGAESLAGVLELTPRDHDSGMPPGCAPAGRRVNRRCVKAAPDKQPRDERVRVPHLPGVEFVAAPDRRGHSRYQFEQAAGVFGVGTQALRALDRLGLVRDVSVTPAAHLVPEEAEAAGCADADGAFGDHASLTARAPCRRLLDHETSLGHTYLER